MVVINVANAIGTLADDLNVRLSLRANGGVGSLVRLLRDDVDPAVQVRGGGGQRGEAGGSGGSRESPCSSADEDHTRRYQWSL